MASNTPHKPFTPLQTNVIGIGYKKDSFGRKIETKKSNDALDKVKRASRPPASTTTNRNSRSRSRSKYELGAKSKERRELCSTRPLSWYWFLWRASKWEIFLDGSKHRTFQDAKKAQKKTSELKEKSGVYEFCITMPNSKKHFKVYVGHTKNMRRRHHEDYRSRGSHLLKVFEDCMRKGLIVHRRGWLLLSLFNLFPSNISLLLKLCILKVRREPKSWKARCSLNLIMLGIIWKMVANELWILYPTTCASVSKYLYK